MHTIRKIREKLFSSQESRAPLPFLLDISFSSQLKLQLVFPIIAAQQSWCGLFIEESSKEHQGRFGQRG